MSSTSDEIRRRIAEYIAQQNGNTGGADPFSAIPSQAAPSQVPYWEPGQTYAPGALVQANNYGSVSQTVVSNGGFEDGPGPTWIATSPFTIGPGTAFEGVNSCQYAGGAAGPYEAASTDRAFALPSYIISASCKVITSVNATVRIGLRWYNTISGTVDTSWSDPLTGASTSFRTISVSGRAPLDTISVGVVLEADGVGTAIFDDVQWNHFVQDDQPRLIFEATQTDTGVSGQVEPVWPGVADDTVVDNTVTWTAKVANSIVWEARPILLSGDTEPTWPLEEGAVVTDGTILWTAQAGRILDENCPNTKAVAIASGKVFAIDDDIIPYCATNNPLDWSSAQDAGYIPFGLNTYGGEPASALGIYRSNLVIWNSKAFQMWQVDPDPQNFAILDAVPVGSRFYRSASPVSNDLVWLTDEGIRSMGIAGASTNLQAGFFGKQIDPLVKAALAGMSDEDDILSLYFPGEGQYWLIFGTEAFVLTMNGGKADMSWSRYTFPSAIDYATIRDGVLFLRSGDIVWQFDEDAVQDDVGGTPVNFEGRVWWHYVDFGALGITKSMIGFDVVGTGTFNVAVGYDQSNPATATTDYQLTGDTLPNGVIPLPVTAPSFQLRLTWPGGEAWEWFASSIYLQNWRITS